MRFFRLCYNLFRPLFLVVLISFLGPPDQVLAQYRPDFPMPNVIGLTVSQAESRILSAGSTAGATSAKAIIVSRRNDSRPAGQIIQQLEEPGKSMRPYRDDVGGEYGQVTFSVVVSDGPALAPDYIGEPLNIVERRARRENVNLNIGNAIKNSQIFRGNVSQQDPAPGQPMSERRVTVYPSAGFPLPNYINRPFEDAKRNSQNLKFRLESKVEDNLYTPNGIVFDQEPDSGTLLPFEEPVRVKVSRGWPIPQFIGKNQSEADIIAGEIRIELNSTGQDNFEVPAGVIFSQQPPAGDFIPDDRTVNVIVSRGYPLPNLVGKHENEAHRLATELKFNLEISRVPLVSRAVDLIEWQHPSPGTRLPIDRPVTIVISEGWPTPNFLSLGENQAASLASDKQVNLRVSERRQDRNTQPGIVIEQSPLPDTLLPPGQAVNIVVSTGYPTPRFIGLKEFEAISLAERKGIVLHKETKPSLDLTIGIVTGQIPAPDAPLPADDKVSIIISSGWPIPDFVGKSEQEANRIASENYIILLILQPG